MLKFHSLMRVLAIFAITALFLPVVSAQVLNGTLTGSVVDASEAVIPNASVTITDIATGREYKESTDSAGVFTFNNLPNGFYKVAVEHAGFAKRSRSPR